MDNDEGLYWHYRKLSRNYRDVGELAQVLKDWIQDLMPSLDGLAADLLAYALDEIAWDEIAQAIRDDDIEE